jgi:hypothetical protein
VASCQEGESRFLSAIGRGSIAAPNCFKEDILGATKVLFEPKLRIKAMYLYQKLFLGLLWLFLAAFFFLWSWWFPNQPAFSIGNTGISVGWACVVLGLYNFLRWWFSRSALARRRAQAEAAARDEGDKSNPNSQSKA